MTYLMQTLADASTSAALLTLAALSTAVLATLEGSNTNDEEDFEPDFNLHFSKEELRAYNENVEQTDARIAELVETLDATPGNAREIEEELVALYLARAARLQEEGENEAATDDYFAAFGRMEELVDAYGESVDLLKQLAAARLNYAILLNDSGDLDEADRQYQLSAEANEKLVAFGDAEAKLDLVGLKLNRAAIAFEKGNRSESLDALDETIEEFQRIAETDPSRDDDALFYLAKALVAKADFLRDALDEEDVESPEAEEARESIKRAVDVYRALVNSGRANYKRDLADGLVSWIAASPKRSKEDLVDAIDALTEACRAYESVVGCGETDAIVDLFDATMQRAELLLRAEREKEALAIYDYVVDTYKDFGDSDELPLLEGLAVAYQRRAQLRKKQVKPDKTIDDLNKAIGFQMKIADDLIASLKEEDDRDHRDHERCGCGDCDHEHCDYEHCGCGDCGGAGRKFLVEKWVNDNFRALTECLWERAVASLEKKDSGSARGDCLSAAAVERAYRKVLRKDEKLDLEFANMLRDMLDVM